MFLHIIKMEWRLGDLAGILQEAMKFSEGAQLPAEFLFNGVHVLVDWRSEVGETIKEVQDAVRKGCETLDCTKVGWKYHE